VAAVITYNIASPEAAYTPSYRYAQPKSLFVDPPTGSKRAPEAQQFIRAMWCVAVMGPMIDSAFPTWNHADCDPEKRQATSDVRPSPHARPLTSVYSNVTGWPRFSRALHYPVKRRAGMYPSGKIQLHPRRRY